MYLSKDCCQLRFFQVRRRFYDIGERDGNILEYCIVGPFIVEVLQHVKEVGVTKSSQYSDLPNTTGAMKFLHDKEVAGFFLLRYNSDEATDVQIVAFAKVAPRGLVSDG